MRVIGAGLSKCENLEEVVISGHYGPQALVELDTDKNWSVACTSLKKMIITKNWFENAGAEWLARVLCRCRNIQHIDLSQNGGDLGAKDIFTSIHSMGSLQSFLTVLNLGGNTIGREGAHAVSKCLQFWPNLHELDLSSNFQNRNIGREGAMALAQNLHFCTQLTRLSLLNNNINEDVALTIVLALTNSTNLSELDLSHNLTSKWSKSEVKKCAAEFWGNNTLTAIIV